MPRFSHEFRTEKLGFSVGLVKYGEDRAVVEVTSTRPECELYPDALKPRDELVAIGGRVVVCANADDFHHVLRELRSGQRPLSLTFVRGDGDAYQDDDLLPYTTRTDDDDAHPAWWSCGCAR